MILTPAIILPITDLLDDIEDDYKYNDEGVMVHMHMEERDARAGIGEWTEAAWFEHRDALIAQVEAAFRRRLAERLDGALDNALEAAWYDAEQRRLN